MSGLIKHSKRGMIARDQVMPLLLKACPSFTHRWTNYVASSYSPGDEQLLYIDLAEFASHLIDLHQKGMTDEFADVFAVVEQLHLEGEPFVKEAATMGLLEAIQNMAGEPEPFVQYLRPESKQWWHKLNDFWNGKKLS